MICVGTERQELSKFIILVEMIITGSSVLCWVELKIGRICGPTII
jgi:hypothetical protein